MLFAFCACCFVFFFVLHMWVLLPGQPFPYAVALSIASRPRTLSVSPICDPCQ